MSTVYRAQFSTLWITLQSNEQLGLLDSDYLEDYYGNDGQVTLHHIDSGIDYPVLMLHVSEETPEIPFDVFRGQTSLAILPNGDYEVRGRCRDLAGNYTILSAFESPLGTEAVSAQLFNILQGQITGIGTIKIAGVLDIALTPISDAFSFLYSDIDLQDTPNDCCGF